MGAVGESAALQRVQNFRLGGRLLPHLKQVMGCAWPKRAPQEGHWPAPMGLRTPQ